MGGAPPKLKAPPQNNNTNNNNPKNPLQVFRQKSREETCPACSTSTFSPMMTCFLRSEFLPFLKADSGFQHSLNISPTQPKHGKCSCFRFFFHFQPCSQIDFGAKCRMLFCSKKGNPNINLNFSSLFFPTPWGCFFFVFCFDSKSRLPVHLFRSPSSMTLVCFSPVLSVSAQGLGSPIAPSSSF